MLSKKTLGKIQKTHKGNAQKRRDIQAISSELLGASKRAIFAVQRSDLKTAEKELSSGTELIKKGKVLIKTNPRLEQEGIWRSALEEFAEGYLYTAVINGKGIDEVPGISLEETEIYLGALSDLSGELTRSCVLFATKRDIKRVEALSTQIREIVSFLLNLDLTGNLRQKFDQAKQNLRKVEEIAFSLSLTK